MKNTIIRNVCAIALFLFSTAEAIVLAKYSSFRWYDLMIDQLLLCFGICFIRFDYFFVEMKIHFTMFKWSQNDDYDEEPNKYGVYIVKLIGCVLLFATLFFYAVLA